MAGLSNFLIPAQQASPASSSNNAEEPLEVYIQEAMSDNDGTSGSRDTFKESFTLISSTAETLAGKAGSSGFLGHLSAGKDWIASKHTKVQPWSEFFSIKSVNRPKASEVAPRLLGNLQHYQSNYLFVFLGLLVYSM